MSVTAVLIAMLTGGLLAFVKDLIQWIYHTHHASRPDRVEAQKVHESVAAADQSLIVVARARDILASDNASLRQERQGTAKRHAAERAEWARERTELRREIDALEERPGGAKVQKLKTPDRVTESR